MNHGFTLSTSCDAFASAFSCDPGVSPIAPNMSSHQQMPAQPNSYVHDFTNNFSGALLSAPRENPTLPRSSFSVSPPDDNVASNHGRHPSSLAQFQTTAQLSANAAPPFAAKYATNGMPHEAPVGFVAPSNSLPSLPSRLTAVNQWFTSAVVSNVTWQPTSGFYCASRSCSCLRFAPTSPRCLSDPLVCSSSSCCCCRRCFQSGSQLAQFSTCSFPAAGCQLYCPPPSSDLRSKYEWPPRL